MADNPFHRLAPFIQEYIYRKGWEELRPIQVQAISAILDTPNHVLIASGTASGKTEAALLPILTDLDRRPSSSIGVLYIGPLKALINDQFERLQALLEETDIPVQSWHGDVAQGQKERFLKRAQGILQITPESLEAMLINRNADLRRLFGDLRYVVLDEVHALIGSDRGRQVLCQLGRLARVQAQPARRVGLSATIGDTAAVQRWLAGGTRLPTLLLEDKQGKRDVELGLEYFLTPDPDEEEDAVEAEAPSTEEGEEDGQEPAEELELTDPAFADGLEPEPTPDPVSDLMSLLEDETALYEHIYGLCRRARKTLIFANSRSEVEETAAALRQIAEARRTPDIYHTHHGSIAAPARLAAEDAMRDASRPACVAATVTLELGIDIGQLDQVLQIDATYSVSSFVQRLGRSGRRGGPARMFFYSCETPPGAKALLCDLIPWNLLQSIAVVQLYAEERWVEPPSLPHLPVSLLYHQTMSVLAAAVELAPAQLAERVLTLPPFAGVTQEQYRTLLRHLLATRHLQQVDMGGLIIGDEGEKIVNNYRFYATFADEKAIRVLAHGEEIGTIQMLPEVGDRFRLGGYTWRALSVDAEQSVVHVARARGRAKIEWMGGGGAIHTRVVQRMRQALQEDAVYGYLHPRAQNRLQQARRLARDSGLAFEPVLAAGPDRWLLLPWRGTTAVETLALVLEHAGMEVKVGRPSFYCEAAFGSNALPAMQRALDAVEDSPRFAAELAQTAPDFELYRAKYDLFAPIGLLREAYASDHLNLTEAVVCIKELLDHQ